MERSCDPVLWALGLLCFSGAHFLALTFTQQLSDKPISLHSLALLVFPLLTLLLVFTTRVRYVAHQSLIVRFGLLIAAAWLASFLSVWLGGRLLGEAYKAQDVALLVTALITTTFTDPFMSPRFFIDDSTFVLRTVIQLFSALWFLQLTLVLIPYALTSAVTQSEVTKVSVRTNLSRSFAALSHTITRIFATLLVMATAAFAVAGNSFLNAYTLAAGTLSLGGFTAELEGLARTSAKTQAVTLLVILLATAGFARHVRWLQTRQLSVYVSSRECRAMALLLVFLIGSAFLRHSLGTGELEDAEWKELISTLWDTTVAIVLMATTTAPALDGLFSLSSLSGFGNSPEVFLACVGGLIGGCGGSTSGGLKVARILGLVDYVRGTLTSRRIVRTSSTTVPVPYFHMLPFFLLLWLIAFIVGVLLLFVAGIPLDESSLAVILSLTNTGLGPADSFAVGSFPYWHDWTRFVLIALMLIGRFEFGFAITFLSWRYWSGGRMNSRVAG